MFISLFLFNFFIIVIIFKIKIRHTNLDDFNYFIRLTNMFCYSLLIKIIDIHHIGSLDPNISNVYSVYF